MLSGFEELKEFLSIPSISADPELHGECRRCADWLLAHLKHFGLSARLLETGGLPTVYAEHHTDPARPTLVFYGHYDVQPAEKSDGWDTDPFKPVIKGDRLYVRGASDDKGPVFSFIQAVGDKLKKSGLNCNVKIFVEGEEESGSQGISKAAASWSELLKGDMLLVLDTSVAADGRPAITLGLRGIASLTVMLSGPLRDLHSGVHGGIAPNPALELARMLAKLHDQNLTIAVPGFYAGIKPLSAALSSVLTAMPFAKDRYRELTGVDPVGGEKDKAPLERLCLRPTIEINGIHSGYGGSGSKTIIPMRAMAKITMRLVGGQDPKNCLELVEKFLAQNAPAGLELECTEQKVHGGPLLVDPESFWVKRSRKILDSTSDKGATFILEGASIPIIPALANAGGLEPVLVGFGQEEDRIHGANESAAIPSLEAAYKFSLALLEDLSK